MCNCPPKAREVRWKQHNAMTLIHIVDDDETMRTALQRLLTEGGFQTRVYESTGEFLLEPLPDQSACLLLDLQLPGPSGLELQAALQRRNVEIPVIFLTGHADVASSVRAMKAGAVDFLEKPIEPEILFAAIRNALTREDSLRTAREPAERLHKCIALLTPQEREVFERTVAGRLNKQIAYELGISERTVKTRRAAVMAKLGANSAADLVRQSEQLRRLSNRDGPR
jgi:RNA polymerase sigma factor (sigma-70 family)